MTCLRRNETVCSIKETMRGCCLMLHLLLALCLSKDKPIKRGLVMLHMLDGACFSHLLAELPSLLWSKSNLKVLGRSVCIKKEKRKFSA